MFLAFSISDLITVPFGYLLGWLYNWTSSYGVALLVFAVIVKLVLFPLTAKGKKGTMKMARLSPQMQALQKKYADDPQRQQQAIRELQQREGVSMTGSCLWSLIPILLIFPLYAVVRQPITYLLHETAEVAGQIVEAIKAAAPDLFSGNSYYHQMIAARHIPEFAEQIKTAVSGVNASTLAGVNFDFLGIDMGAVPQFNVFGWSSYDWAHFGAFLVPLLSAGSQMLSMFIGMKMNNSLVTNDKGVQDDETAKSSQVNQTNKMMIWMMPIMSLWIGFTVPAALSLYWMVQGLISGVIDMYLTKRYRTIYDAEDAVRLQKAMEEEAIAAEKERQRAARRAANPDGITENTSKKKQQQQKAAQKQAARESAARDYAARNGVQIEEEPEKRTLSGIPERPYCKGRAYDPDRYSQSNTEE